MNPAAADLPVTARIRKTLKRLIGCHSSINRIAASLNLKGHSSLSRMLSGTTPMKLETAESICLLIGIDPEILHRYVVGESTLTARQARQLLNLCCDTGQTASEHRTWLASLTTQLPAWLVGSPSHSVSKRAEIVALDEWRIEQPLVVHRSLRVLIRDLLNSPVSPGARADLAMALAVWSALQRFKGRRAQARDGNLAALRCLEELDDPFALGFVYRKIAFVVAEFDQLETTRLFCSAAGECFFEAADLVSTALIIVDKGCFAKREGDLASAERHLRKGLRLLPPTDTADRAVALQCLAEVYRLTARLPQALEALSEAESCSTTPVAAAFLAWRKAQILGEQGQHLAAARQLVPAAEVMAREGEPIDAALISIDLAASLLLIGQTATLHDVLANIANLIAALGHNKEAQSAVEQIVCVYWRSELTQTVLAENRCKIETAGHQRRPA